MPVLSPVPFVPVAPAALAQWNTDAGWTHTYKTTELEVFRMLRNRPGMISMFVFSD